MTMTQAKPRFLSFEEYLSYDDGTNKFYKLVDPGLQQATVLSLNEGRHTEVGEFHDQDRVVPPILPELTLTAQQILDSGR